MPEERYVRPESLTRGLTDYLRGRGVEVREHAAVVELRPSGGRAVYVGGGAWRVRTRDDELSADAVVVAAGAWSPTLLSTLGIRMPMEAAKGYSITARGTGTLPQHALYLAEGKVGTSTFDDALRIAGIFDLAGMDTSLRRQAHRRDGEGVAPLPGATGGRPRSSSSGRA